MLNPERFRDSIQKRIEHLADSLSSGAYEAEYRSICGEIKGLRWAYDELDAIELAEMREEEEDDVVRS